MLLPLLGLAIPASGQGRVTTEVVSQAIANTCERPPDPTSQAVVAGVVLDSISGVGIPQVEVTLTWHLSEPDTFATQTRMTGPGGFFAFCNVPAGGRAELTAHRRVKRGPIVWTIDPGQLYVQNVLLPLSMTTGSGILVGQIVDADTGRPVQDASVRLTEIDQTTTTNNHGMFTLGDQPFGVYTLEVERLGYEGRSLPVRVEGDRQQSVQVQISKQPFELEGLNVSVQARSGRLDMDGLIRRMNLGFGSFVTVDELKRRPMARITDLLRGTAGVAVYVNQLDHTFTIDVRGRVCEPDVFIDGVRYHGTPNELDFPRASDLEAVEVYKGIAEIPGIYTLAKRERQCGVIAVWRRAQGISD